MPSTARSLLLSVLLAIDALGTCTSGCPGFSKAWYSERDGRRGCNGKRARAVAVDVGVVDERGAFCCLASSASSASSRRFVRRRGSSLVRLRMRRVLRLPGIDETGRWSMRLSISSAQQKKEFGCCGLLLWRRESACACVYPSYSTLKRLSILTYGL